ncbi:RIB43A-like with coiled-coils protein 1 isoform X2 [Rana temporaria]|uniref:RIB43A-like with coiled-coils protein 1 isoform X2 n=1 Tax=Rana temporaria TaxID=8407 RepID=UPI001AAD925F|nr:RIB43A-like with coiled-coils protein 1 isoform X2 [Rana temporaria]
MYKLDLPADPKETAAIERRRNMEQQRQSRIFNAKVRTIGVDVPTLERQTEERKAMEGLERARDRAFDADRQRCDKIAMMLEEREGQVARDLDKAVLQFREQHQQPGTRREYDLYDPDALKKERPARVGDHDPRCGPASLQKLAGEDLSEKERKKLQAELSRKWLSDQKEERKRSEAQKKYADELYDKKRVELDERAQHLTKMEEECRKAVNMAVTNLNQALRLKEEEKQEDVEWDRQRMLAARAAMTLEQQEEELNREIRKRTDQYNQQLSREQRAHLEYLEKVVYTNNPTAHYHSQFNTTSR